MRITRLAAVLALAVFVSIAAAGCIDESKILDTVACATESVSGTLLMRDSGMVLADASWMQTHWAELGVRWPAGWTTRVSAAGKTELLEPSGTVAATVGETAYLFGRSAGGMPLIENGVLIVCK